MPHSIECLTLRREAFGVNAYEGWCMGASCTFTREDAPELFDILQEANTRVRRGPFVPTDRRQRADAMTFEVTVDHMKLVERMYWTWDDSGYDGAPAVGLKRPYGNSDVTGDIAEILGWDLSWQDQDEMEDRALKIHREMDTVMQIITSTRLIRPGTYRKTSTYDALSWELVEDE